MGVPMAIATSLSWRSSSTTPSMGARMVHEVRPRSPVPSPSRSAARACARSCSAASASKRAASASLRRSSSVSAARSRSVCEAYPWVPSRSSRSWSFSAWMAAASVCRTSERAREACAAAASTLAESSERVRASSICAGLGTMLATASPRFTRSPTRSVGLSSMPVTGAATT
jgi:hypothetical protein